MKRSKNRANGDTVSTAKIEFLPHTRSELAAAKKVVDDIFWGVKDETISPYLRLPLPPTDAYPVIWRKCGNIDGWTELPIPPYFTAALWGENLEVGLWEGDGYRVGFGDRNRKDPTPDADFVYADSENMPEAWRVPVADALAKTRETWPGKDIVFRPRVRCP